MTERRAGFWVDVHAWMAEDGEHVVVAHECVQGRDVSQLPHPRWAAEGGMLRPSFQCDLCGVHTTPAITDGPAPPLARRSAETAYQHPGALDDPASFDDYVIRNPRVGEDES